jgi:large subunit ribosomal protein L10Ae
MKIVRAQLLTMTHVGMALCVLGDQHDIDRAKHHGVDAMSTDVSFL